jgi:hypothetical protein
MLLHGAIVILKQFQSSAGRISHLLIGQITLMDSALLSHIVLLSMKTIRGYTLL